MQTQVTVGTQVVYARERSRHPHKDVQVGVVKSSPDAWGKVQVKWPGLLHLPQEHPIYQPQMKAVAVDRLSVLSTES